MVLDLAAPYLTPKLMENPVPGLGQTVTYRLNQLDANVITDRRRRAELAAGEPPHVVGPSGSPVAEGDVYPAIVVKVRSRDPAAEIGLQVLLNGNDQHWIEYASEGHAPGTWCWPDL